jgi:hypothetical protein
MGRFKAMAALGLISAVAVAAICWGFEYDWPDNVHVDYGLPLAWGVHSLNTIAGPVDRWRVDVAALALVVWLGLILCASALLELTVRRG